MMHPYTELRLVSEQMGYGVFAARFIPMGTVVYARDPLDIALPPGHPMIDDPFLADTVEKYTYIEPDGTRVLGWDISKYVNHCCHPSTLTTGYGFEVAVRDLFPGDEITDDYGIFNTPVPFPLICDHAGCRQFVRGDEYNDCVPSWDQRIKPALRRFNDVEQPLLPLIPRAVATAAKRFARTGRGYRSVEGQRIIQPTITAKRYGATA